MLYRRRGQGALSCLPTHEQDPVLRSWSHRSVPSSLPKGSILIGMESTACYHVSLFSFLMALGYSVSVINPLLISNFLKLQLRKTKTDKKDAAVIARFLSAHGASPAATEWPTPISPICGSSPARGRACCIR
ncbi:MAG: IS110 family transposase [Desulfobacterales bacterium]|nr:IS110 family transposase [Desulfobacterales bacterium]